MIIKNLSILSFKDIVKHFFLEDKNFLLAISGGLDSMVLLHLFRLSGLKFQVAHINYQLRGISSNKDSELVEKICNKYNIKVHIKKIDKLLFNESNLSVQMIARNIRYDFFVNLCDSHSLDFICTGHHQDDQVETFFIKLFRSSGLKGLSGMKILDNKIFHPLLNFSKKELLIFARKEKIVWREDKSNTKNIYLRNKIRNQFIPMIESIFPNYKASIINSMLFIRDAQNILEVEFNQIKKKF